MTNQRLRRHFGRSAFRGSVAMLGAALAMTASLVPDANASNILNGAGSTFDQPFFTLASTSTTSSSTLTKPSTMRRSAAAAANSR